MRRNRQGRQAGKGIIAFLVAIVVVLFVGSSLLKTFKVKSRADKMNDFVYETLQSAERLKLKKKDVRFTIVKKASELRLPLDPKAIEITLDDSRWRIHFEWDDELKLLGYTHIWHFKVDRTWNRY